MTSVVVYVHRVFVSASGMFAKGEYGAPDLSAGLEMAIETSEVLEVRWFQVARPTRNAGTAAAER